jgi:hypothetical protein
MSKPYQLTVEYKPGFAHFRVTGPNTPETVRGYLMDIYYNCAQNKHPAILVEENLQGPGLRLFDIFEIVSEGSERTWPYIRRIAYVDTNPEHSPPDMKFAETVAVNRGVNMRLFASVADAEQWLAEEPV